MTEDLFDQCVDVNSPRVADIKDQQRCFPSARRYINIDAPVDLLGEWILALRNAFNYGLRLGKMPAPFASIELVHQESTNS